nr:C19orf29 [Euglena gracilis]
MSDAGEAGQRKDEKQLLKELETPEEKYRRRMEKKERKASLKAREQALLGYTNEANPFNDTNLSETFIWKKKIDKLAEEGRLDPQWRKRLKTKREELRTEIDEVKARRVQRDKEKEQTEQMRAEIQRQEEARNAVEFEKRGEEFEVKQLKMRRDARLREGRATPIDFLSKNLDILFPSEEDQFTTYQMEMREPYQLLEGQSMAELTALKEDLDKFIVYEKHSKAQSYWKSIQVLAEDALDKLRNGGQEAASGIHESVLKEVLAKLSEKTHEEVLQMERAMTQKVKAGGSGVDVEYWSTLLQRLQVLKAQAQLRELHREIVAAFVGRLEQVRALERRREEELEREKQTRNMELENWMKAQECSDGEEGNYSPVLEHGREAEAVDIEQDEREQKRRRTELLAAEKVKQMENEKMQMSAAKEMGLDEKLLTGEALFSEEVDVKHKWYAYYEKYRPRKPKYFNRVHTGYQWNKYNSTHYDYDNPPPKVVMGYKFNIFYPDLVAPPRQQPTYFVEATEKGWDDDVCLIRFHAGPPYEDIAFKIVNKKWEYSSRRGYRCTFERGVLHLYFSFINYRYRR